jgi:hypothetical protein
VATLTIRRARGTRAGAAFINAIFKFTLLHLPHLLYVYKKL